MADRPSRKTGATALLVILAATSTSHGAGAPPFPRPFTCKHTRMANPNWAEAMTAWSSLATAAATVILVVIASHTAVIAIRTLRASVLASEAAEAAAAAAQRANEQTRTDSVEQTRPYVYAEVVSGLAGPHTWDLRVMNAGRSAARGLTLTYDCWPVSLDDVATSIHDWFETPRTLPPGCSIRAIWRLEGEFSDGTQEAGLLRTGTISVSYSSDDLSAPVYSDSFDVLIGKSGFTPMGESGPSPDGLQGDLKKFYLLGQVLVRRITELGR